MSKLNKSISSNKLSSLSTTSINSNSNSNNIKKVVRSPSKTRNSLSSSKLKENHKDTSTTSNEERLSIINLLGNSNIHTKNKASLLSAESGEQNFRGLLNLAAIILVAMNTRLVVENLLKYGVLIELPSLQTFIDNWPMIWPALTTCVILPFLCLLAYFVEYFAWNNRINSNIAIFSHIILISLIFFIPIIIVIYSYATILMGMFLTLVSIMNSMKLISYAHVNHELRYLKSSPIKHDDEMEKLTFPTFGSLIYFLLVPTLCYQPSYPSSLRIRPRFVIRRLIEFIFCMVLITIIIEQYVVPIVKNSMEHLSDMKVIYLLERILKLSVPNLVIWLLFFYGTFHSFFNLLAELLLFGDRQFYKDWWNAGSLGDYWRLWNLPVHNWMLRHLYAPALRFGASPSLAGFICFFFSAVMHEVLVSVPCRSVNWYAFFAMILQVPLITITYFVNKFISPTWSNVSFWVTFCIFGQPLLILLYYYDYIKNRV